MWCSRAGTPLGRCPPRRRTVAGRLRSLPAGLSDATFVGRARTDSCLVSKICRRCGTLPQPRLKTVKHQTNQPRRVEIGEAQLALAGTSRFIKRLRNLLDALLAHSPPALLGLLLARRKGPAGTGLRRGYERLKFGVRLQQIVDQRIIIIGSSDWMAIKRWSGNVTTTARPECGHSLSVSRRFTSSRLNGIVLMSIWPLQRTTPPVFMPERSEAIACSP